MLGRLWPQGDAELRKVLDAGLDPKAILTDSDLVRSDNVFFCLTGITDGELTGGVRYEHGVIRTDSLVMRSKSGTVRMIEAQHNFDTKTWAAAT